MMVSDPVASCRCCVAVADREMVVRADGAPLSPDDLLALREACGAAEWFAEPDNDILVLGIEHRQLLPDGYQWVPIRSFFADHEAHEVLQVSRAKALVAWRQNTRFCGRCGTALCDHESLTARVCPSCGQLIFPRIEPCIIVIVRREGKILLARHVQRNQNIYACIAGFVEAGETIEHAVEREILEETGLKVCNIRYFGSQSWPFPSQLMLGFTADWAGGEIRVQQEELSDAQWFDPNDCPASPPPGSIAYQLIQAQK